VAFRDTVTAGRPVTIERSDRICMVRLPSGFSPSPN